MIDLLNLILADMNLADAILLLLFVGVPFLLLWLCYLKPCRDSLRNIERALLAAPWMQPRNNQGMRRSA